MSPPRGRPGRCTRCTICGCACVVPDADDTLCTDCRRRNFSGNPFARHRHSEALALTPEEVQALLEEEGT